MSTRSTASSRPENSSQVATSLCTTVATETGVACGAGDGVAAALVVFRPTTAALIAVSAVKAVAAAQRPRRVRELRGEMGCMLSSETITYRPLRNRGQCSELAEARQQIYYRSLWIAMSRS